MRSPLSNGTIDDVEQWLVRLTQNRWARMFTLNGWNWMIPGFERDCVNWIASFTIELK